MKLASAVITCAGALLLSSCGGPDLGECDRAKLGGSGPDAGMGMEQPYDGQVLLQTSCAGGRCHSSTATGVNRKGAPADLDFNVLPNSTSDADIQTARKAFGVVSNHISEIWAEVEEGSMPPPPPAGAGALSPSNKEVIRNWLACGAPVAEAPLMADMNADAWTRVYTQLSTQCLICHSPATSAAGGGFALGEMGDACGAYKNVREVATKSSGMCSGRTLVKVNDPTNSVLVQKLTGENLCGSLMPPGTPAAMPFATTNAALVNDLKAWIMSGAPAPAGCN